MSPLFPMDSQLFQPRSLLFPMDSMSIGRSPMDSMPIGPRRFPLGSQLFPMDWSPMDSSPTDSRPMDSSPMDSSPRGSLQLGSPPMQAGSRLLRALAPAGRMPAHPLTMLPHRAAAHWPGSRSICRVRCNS
jgi:hypothetical protein